MANLCQCVYAYHGVGVNIKDEDGPSPITSRIFGWGAMYHE
jgi:hypothetical protein